MIIKMYIYSLIDPRTQTVFWVGQTRNLHNRLINHIRESLAENTPKNKRISELIKNEIVPKITVLEEIEIELSRKKLQSEVSDRERYWTTLLAQDNKLDNLQNNKTHTLSKNKKICLCCSSEYFSFSRKSKFCSAICRVYWHRENKTEQGKVLDDLTTIAKATPAGKPNSGILKAIEINNLPENKERILKERNTVVPKPADVYKYPAEATKHKLWKQGDPPEGSNSFYLRYGAFTYDQI